MKSAATAASNEWTKAQDQVADKLAAMARETPGTPEQVAEATSNLTVQGGPFTYNGKRFYPPATLFTLASKDAVSKGQASGLAGVRARSTSSSSTNL